MTSDRLASLGLSADVVLIAPSTRHLGASVSGPRGPDARAWAPSDRLLHHAVRADGTTGDVAFDVDGLVGDERQHDPIGISRRTADHDPRPPALGRGGSARPSPSWPRSRREEVGPQTIDLSVLELTTSRDMFLEEYDVTGLNPHGRLVEIGYPPTGTYQCADGPFSLACYQVHHWEAF